MLYVLHGENIEKREKKLKSLVATLLEKKPDAEMFSLDEDNWNLDKLNELIESAGLFSRNYIVVLKRLWNFTDSKDIVKKALIKIQESPHVFILIEDKLLAKDINTLSKRAVKIQEFNESSKKEKEEFNVFSFTDSLGERRRGKAWTLFQSALLDGKDVSELHSLSVWLFKTITLASNTKNAKEAGLKPFVYGKAKKFLNNYSKEEIRENYFHLIKILHEERRGNTPIAISFEKFILGL